MKISCLLTIAIVHSLVLAAAGHTIASDRITRLYGNDATLDGGIRYEKGPSWMVVTAAGSASWNVTTSKSGEYQVSLCYAAKDTARASLGTEKSRVEADLGKTDGVFPDPAMNFERVPLDGKLRLNEGANTITLRIEAPAVPPLRFRSIELTPVAAERDMQRDSAAARANRANTNWLANAAYGLMFHWTSQSQPRSGPQKPYAEAVKAFDVPAFGKMVEETGAAYVLFTVNHATPHCPAPIQSWERVHPGMTTQRDLIGEIAAELAKRKTRLMLYFASHTMARLNKVTAEEYEQIHRDVLTEFGTRYGERISGYWFDGWYQSLQAYPEISMERLWKPVKAGNPNRLVAYNFWIYPVETDWQDYWAAEVGGIVKLADGQFPSSGPGKGLQYQNLIMADAPWVHSKPDTEMEKPHFSNESLIEFVKGCKARKGAVTINLGIYQDGKIGDATMKQMIELRKAIRGR